MGDSQANGAAAQAVTALVEQVHVIKAGLGSHLGTHLLGSHAVTSWLMSMPIAGQDGRIPCERWKRNNITHETVESGERCASS